MSYVDGFVIPVSEDKIEDYKALSNKARVVWMEHGALDYKECKLDDLGMEQLVSFRDLAGAKEGETVIFAFIIHPSKAERDEVNKKVHEDERMKEICGAGMPFDMARMAFGGFETIVGE